MVGLCFRITSAPSGGRPCAGLLLGPPPPRRLRRRARVVLGARGHGSRERREGDGEAAGEAVALEGLSSAAGWNSPGCDRTRAPRRADRQWGGASYGVLARCAAASDSISCAPH